LTGRPGQILLTAGARSSEVYFVLDGRLQVALFSLNGREVILREMGKGAVFGEIAAIDQQPRSASITALSDCALTVVPASVFCETVTTMPEAALWLARRLTAQVRDLTEKVFELNALTMRDRLYCELLRLGEESRRATGDTIIEPSPTHADLASRIGSHREAVTREMRYLVQSGLVRQERRRITMLDIPRLRALVRDSSTLQPGLPN